MDLNIDIEKLVLVMARITPLFAGAGISPFSRIPLMVRLVLVLIFGFAVTQMVPLSLPGDRFWLFAVLSELMFGLVVLLVLQAALTSVLFWGRIIDMQVGFGAAAILNPATRNQDSLLGTILSLALVTLFFLTGVHHLLLEFMVNSFRVFPLGETAIGAGGLNLTMHKIAMFFGLEYMTAMLIFAPVMIVIWILDVMVAYLSKTMPQMNIYFITLPLKIAIGISILVVSVHYAKPLLNNLFSQMITFLDQLG